jgi:hypothetical protein
LNPENDRLAIDEEMRVVDNQIRLGTHRDRVRLVPCLAARPEDLAAALNRVRPHVVHFSGHAGKRGLILASERYRWALAEIDPLKRLFRGFKDIRLIVLNACWTQPAASALSEIVGCAVGTRGKVSEGSSIQFAGAFYNAVASGQSVETAFEQALFVMDSEGFGRKDNPILLSRANVDPSRIVLVPGPGSDGETPPEAIAEALGSRTGQARTQLDPYILRRIPREFVTRDVTPRVREAVASGTPAAVSIVGPAGFGKTTLLGQLFDELDVEEVGWRAVLLCADVVVEKSDGLEQLALRMGQAATGMPVPLPRLAAEMVRLKGPGVLLVDTVDLLLNEPREAAIRSVLAEVVEAGATVVFTCRDWEYDTFLAPARGDGSVFGAVLQRMPVPPFTDEEVADAASLFLTTRHHRPASEAARFAESLLRLSSDSRPLGEIVHSPLLLALLCELFGQAGTVPADLTVAGLYDRYWNERVAVDRSNRTSTVALRKVDLCYQLAQGLFRASTVRLAESLDRGSLALRDEDDTRAFHLLSSERIWLDPETSGRIRFFHQTFLEYAIARWLLRDGNEGEVAALLSGLRGTGAHAQNLHWWPVVRLLLARADDAAFREIMGTLDLRDIAAFRTVALAAVASGREGALPELVEVARREGATFRKALFLALSNGALPASPAVWGAAMALLDASATPEELSQAVETVGPLAPADDDEFAERLEATITAVLRWRSAGTDVRPAEKKIVLGTLVKEALNAPTREPGPRTRAVLRGHLHGYGLATAETVIRLHLEPATAPAELAALLHLLLQQRPPKGSGRVLSELLTLFAPWGSRVPESQWKDWRQALYAALPADWDVIQARAAGLRASTDAELLARITEDLLAGPSQHTRVNLVALDTAIESGAAAPFADALLAHPGPVRKDRSSAIGELVSAAAPRLGEARRGKVRSWLRAAALAPEDAVPALAALGGRGAAAACAALTAGLPGPVLKRVVIRSLHRADVELSGKLLRGLLEADRSFAGDPDVLAASIGVDRRRALGGDDDAVRRVVAGAGSRSALVARAAADAVEELAAKVSLGDVLDLPDLLPLTVSAVPKVRTIALSAIATSVRRKASPSTALLEAALARALDDPVGNVVQSALDVAAALVEANLAALQPLGARLMEMLAERAKAGKLDASITRGVTNVLKTALRQWPAGTASQIAGWTRQLLGIMDTALMNKTQANMVELLTELARRDPGFLPSLIELFPSLPSKRSMYVIVRAIERVNGRSSPLLAQILALPGCPEEARRLIVSFHQN